MPNVLPYLTTVSTRLAPLALAALLTLAPNALLAQGPWPVEVTEHAFGPGQTFGQEADYFPANVLNAVDPTVSPTTPAATPQQVVSLGRDGYLVLRFDPPIVDGPGRDFTVFENVLQAPTLVFDEWLIVAVSDDGGQTFRTFPYDSLTGQGLAGRTPTNGPNVDHTNAAQCGGDGFDLATLGLAQATHVRLQDATRWQTADRLSAEVDGVVAHHQAPTSRPSQHHARAPFWLGQHPSGQLALHLAKPLDGLRLMDLAGRTLWQAGPLQAGEQIMSKIMPKGAYVALGWADGFMWKYTFHSASHYQP